LSYAYIIYIIVYKSSSPTKGALAVPRERNAKRMRAEYDFSKGKRGAVLPQKGKTRISIFIDNTVLDAFRARAEKMGTGYQTMMNEVLRQHLSDAKPPLTEAVLRHVLRQEISEYLLAASPPTDLERPKPKRRRST
jgi:uncharacterized protein (DUF4415 family)